MCLDLPGKASAARDAPKFKDYILPLIFLQRLSGVFEDAIQALEQDFGSQHEALRLADADHQLVRFFVPEKARWTIVATKWMKRLRRGFYRHTR